MSKVDFSIPAWKRAARANYQVGTWQTRGSRGRTISFGGKCRRCREYLPTQLLQHRGLCNLCRAYILDSPDPDDRYRWGDQYGRV